MREFFHVVTTDELVKRLSDFPMLAPEIVELDQACGRVLCDPIVSPEDLPVADRSTMDGFAVSAQDTFGASNSIPALLELTAPVQMGKLPTFEVMAGGAAPIPTGGFLPKGADAVVMVEHTAEVDGRTVEVYRPVSPGQHVLGKGEDVKTGKGLWPAGRRLRPWDIGLMAGLGIVQVNVRRRPNVAVISTGDEIVPIDQAPGFGQIRDANLHGLCALVEAAGAVVHPFEIVPDRLEAMKAAIRDALACAQIVVLSGGSSVGERDLVVEAITQTKGATVLAHGVAVSPGKPTLLARVGDRAVFGLPGHPVSALIVARLFLEPFLFHLEGEPMRKGPLGQRVSAVLSSSVSSKQGREEYLRVRLEDRDGQRWAVPVFGKSGMLSTLTSADGLVCIPTHSEGIARDQTVEVVLL